MHMKSLHTRVMVIVQARKRALKLSKSLCVILLVIILGRLVIALLQVYSLSFMFNFDATADLRYVKFELFL